MIDQFKKALILANFSMNTVSSYVYTVEHYFTKFDDINKTNLLLYKGLLLEKYKAKTVNLRIQGINKYLEFIDKVELKIKFVKIQQKNFIENVISKTDYDFFKYQLKKPKTLDWYFVVWFLGATGARVSELIQIKVEHVKVGYIDIYSKGGKIRRIYISKKLQMEAIKWLKGKSKDTGYIFCNRKGDRLTTRGIAHQLKKLANDCGLNLDVIYPHSFRHMFAKNFLIKCNDIAFLADLMGHESIETTRIYLRRTCEEQRELIDKIITW